ncbi:MAG TPA: cupin domain-containing protein [Kiloniellales bacterium]|nr:cupin domain-containing protein [Kiloniellales bacterium]
MSNKLARDRTAVNWKKAKFTTYSLQGEPQRDLTWHNLSWDDSTGSGLFLIRFAPGGISIPHEHLAREEFVVLEGELEDNDGHIYRAGDCVSLAPGSKHFTRSKTGATSAVFVHGGFRTLPAHEVPADVFDQPKRKKANGAGLKKSAAKAKKRNGAAKPAKKTAKNSGKRAAV